jgi:hypothetical protein
VDTLCWLQGLTSFSAQAQGRVRKLQASVHAHGRDATKPVRHLACRLVMRPSVAASGRDLIVQRCGCGPRTPRTAHCLQGLA